MKIRDGIALAVLAAFQAGIVSADDPGAPQLIVRATYDTGLGANGAEVISVRHTDAMAVLTNIAGSVDILDLSDPFNPVSLQRVPIDTTTGSPNSVAIHPHHDYFLVVTGKSAPTGLPGTVFAYRLDGTLLDSATVGNQPDSIAISPNGRYAVIANEAEGTEPPPGASTGSNGGPGSISVIDLSGFNGVVPAELVVTTIALSALDPLELPGLSSGRTDDLARLSIDHTPGTLEPEGVAFSPDSRLAYLTLQENNAVIRLNLHTGELEVLDLGRVDHLADLTVNTPPAYVPNQLLTAFREPDGIEVDQTGRFFITADEGDTRNATGGGSVRGGRTVSVFDADSGNFIADTGSQLDDVANAAGLYPDSRSNRGGSEPEGLDLTHFGGITIAAVALERANAVALVDLSRPSKPKVAAIAPVGVGPETVKFFRIGSRLFIASANEVSGTVSILEVVVSD